MTLGLFPSKGQVDAQAGQLSLAIMADFTRVQELKAWMDTQSDANLIALGYVQAEVNTLRSAITDLNTLASIYTGAVAQGVTPYDYRTFSKLLYGMGVL